MKPCLKVPDTLFFIKQVSEFNTYWRCQEPCVLYKLSFYLHFPLLCKELIGIYFQQKNEH